MKKRKCHMAITGPRTWAIPPKERSQHQGGLIRQVIPGSIHPGHYINRYRAVWECPLDVYRAYGVISREQYRAGLRFHRAYYGVVLLRRRDFRPVTEEHAAWKKTGVEKLLELAHENIEPADMNAVIEICGHSQQARNLRALACLKRGLSSLASHWSIAAREACDARRH